MKRKFRWHWLLCILFIGILVCMPTETAKAEVNFNFEFNEKEQVYYVSGLSIEGSEEEVVFPTTYEGYSVVGIETSEPRLCIHDPQLKKAIIPYGYTSIGEHAFVGSYNLEEVVIYADLKAIGEGAFSGCSSLKKINLPDTLESIGEHAFQSNAMEEITIPKSVTSIGEYAFNGCSNLEKVSLKANIKTLKSHTFSDCSKLVKITLPSTLKKIESSAFSDSGLKSITIPKNVTTIEHQAFMGCEELEKVTIKAKIKTLKADTFGACSKLEKIVFPSTLKTIESFAFSGAGFKTITIPKTVKKIENAAFGCSNLYRIIFEGNDIELEGFFYNHDKPIQVTFIAKPGSNAYKYAKQWGLLTTESKKFKVELSGTKMYVGEKKKLDTYNNPYPIKWTSSNKKVVAIDEDGYITAKKKGSATLTAKINGKKYKYKMKVVKRTEKNVLDIIWNSYVTKDMSDYEKIVAANKWLCVNVQYDYKNYKNNTVPAISYTAQGALEKGIAVCDGYTRAFMKIIEHYGIPVKRVVGYGRDESHSWNLVKIGTRWYYVDVTWNDPVSDWWMPWNHFSTGNLLLTNSQMKENGHSWIESAYPKASAKAPDTSVTTVNKNGTKISAIEKFLKVGKSTTLKVTGTSKKVTWSSSNKKIVTVNSKGKITAKKAGTAKIYCKVGGKKYTIKITVEK